jgi:hypothetical protein
MRDMKNYKILGRRLVPEEVDILKVLAEGKVPEDKDGCLMADVGYLSFGGLAGLNRQDVPVITNKGLEYLEQNK